jgi:hypothetical protein
MSHYPDEYAEDARKSRKVYEKAKEQEDKK